MKRTFSTLLSFAIVLTVCGKNGSTNAGGTTPTVNTSALSVDKPQWKPTKRQLTNTAVEKAGTVDITGSGSAAGATVTVDRSTGHQEIWGFGASITGPAIDFKRDLSAKTQNEVFDLLFLNEGDNLGFSVTRMNINPNIMPAPGKYDWAVDEAQGWFAQQVYKRYTAPITALPWSPPAWMKDNNSTKVGNLLPENVGALAQWFYDWTQYYRNNYDLNIKWLSMQNEPNAAVKWDGCNYTPAELEKLLLTTIDLFRSKGSKVAIGGPEHSTDQGTQDILDAWSPETRAKMDWIAHHNYKSVRDPQKDLDFRKYGKPNLMTEVCGGPVGEDETIVDGLMWASHIQRALSRDEKGFVFWQLVRDAASDQGLLKLRTGKDVYEKSKRTFVFGQYSRFIRPGYIVVDSKTSDDNLLVTAAKHPETGKASVAMVNRTQDDINITLKGLTGKTIGGRITSEQYDFAATKDIPASVGGFAVRIPAMSIVSVAEK